MENILSIVNPVYSTGVGTASMLAARGDKDAVALMQKIHTQEGRQGQGAASAMPAALANCFCIGQQARYEIYNALADRSGKANIVDLPCGYTPRGVRVTAQGKHYFGLDLPIVIDEMAGAAAKVMTPKQAALAVYQGVDATNYASLRNALDGVDGELCIVTEGLIPYFNDPELASMCEAVHRLLAEFGGCWITADHSVVGIYGETFRALYGGDESTMLALTKQSASGMADVKLCQNAMCANGPAAAEAFLNKQGFKVEKHSIAGYLPDLDGVDTAKLREAYRPMDAWIMTVNTADAAGADTADPDIQKQKPFSASIKTENGSMTVTLRGRLDTLTAPELLEQFESAKAGVTACTVNAKALDYVSSAGLRVLLMMYKALNGNMKMEQVNDGVKEILEMTGFGQYFL